MQDLAGCGEDGKMELVLTRLPDAATCAEEQREQKVANGWPYEEVYGVPPDSWTDSDEECPDPYTETSAGGSSREGADAMDTT